MQPEKSYSREPVQESKNEISEEVSSSVSSFAPTMPPKKEEIKSKAETEAERLDKYFSSSRKKVINRVFNKQETSTPPVKETVNNGVPRGARTELFRNHGGKSLSQADFERMILGVSTATEVSVKSMICVKGRCFNADEAGRRTNH